jgi:ubiquinone/menaquinone biosynthesis C-methylase UbiE
MGARGWGSAPQKMTKKTPFDDIAVGYDSDFTRSVTGKAQRNIVWRYLSQRVVPGTEILEVNCGTGEDAFFLSENNCRVTATDASAGMIRQCLEKSQAFHYSQNPVFRQAAINELDSVVEGKKFNLIFSNFSGLNCINPEELKEAAAKFYTYLEHGGRLIVVVFGTNCLWEKLYFMLKGKRKMINRRKRKEPVYVKLVNSGIDVYYYSPAELRKLLGDYFKIVRKRPVGLFIPPAYLDRFFTHHKVLFRLLHIKERLTGSFSFLSDLADHYIIQFTKK